jgi:hypothetical protein
MSRRRRYLYLWATGQDHTDIFMTHCQTLPLHSTSGLVYGFYVVMLTMNIIFWADQRVVIVTETYFDEKVYTRSMATFSQQYTPRTLDA